MGLKTSAVLGGVLVVLFGGCGSGPAGGGSTRAATVAPPGAGTREPVSITISAPANGEALTLRPGHRTQQLRVTGFAAPGSEVRVTVGCRPELCVRRVVAGGDGAWRLRLTVRTVGGQRGLSIAAGPADPASADAGNSVLVMVKGGVRRIRVRSRRPVRPVAPTRRAAAPPAAASTTTPAPVAAPAPGGRSRATRVFLVGDSLAEGIATLLPVALPGRSVTVNAKISRPLAVGMQLARAAPGGAILAVSLFTNDDPRGVGLLDAAVRESVRIAGPEACAVWATIVRPPVGGVSYAAANARLEALAADPALAARLRIVPWARAVAANPGWIAGDGVHATPAGYRARAALFAQAIDRC